MRNPLEKYVPHESIPLLVEWLEKNKLHLRISKTRTTKLGDFRPSLKGERHKISVNGDLNPFQFLITLSHEVAHAITWDQYKTRVKPHGIEWQRNYKILMDTLMKKVRFPEVIESALIEHLKRPKASSCSDPKLQAVLRQFDENAKGVLLQELEEGQVFQLQGKRIFKKGPKRRTRYTCLELKTNKLYLINGIAEVLPFKG